jgi:DNA-binding XRE family transcriptional regulator
MAKLTNEVMRWVDDQLAQNAALRERVEARLAELRIEQELIRLREAQGLSQSQPARILGVSQPAVAKIESGSEKLTLRTPLRRSPTIPGVRVRRGGGSTSRS